MVRSTHRVARRKSQWTNMKFLAMTDPVNTHPDLHDIGRGSSRIQNFAIIIFSLK